MSCQRASGWLTALVTRWLILFTWIASWNDVIKSGNTKREIPTERLITDDWQTIDIWPTESDTSIQSITDKHTVSCNSLFLYLSWEEKKEGVGKEDCGWDESLTASYIAPSFRWSRPRMDSHRKREEFAIGWDPLFPRETKIKTEK